MIRLATIEDAPRLAEIQVFGWRCAYIKFISPDLLFNKFTVKMREEKFKEELSATDIPTYVFEENNIIKAFMTMGKCRDEDKDDKTLELYRIYVDPFFQRQTIGTKLMNYCVKEAENKTEIVLWVFEKNIDSIEFYRKMGFKTDGKNKLSENLFALNTKEKEREIRLSKNLKKE
ncbi:MAG: GNAT family N-acetyltransferase [Alphaproteobacteria bacterium]|nr:GNAT family N-acetyltransferase [Alphaproteobacteria bacterium]MCL2505186.1 GNAT family N-acetyltransferase [Alphaproteobacteria bacterium]